MPKKIIALATVSLFLVFCGCAPVYYGNPTRSTSAGYAAPVSALNFKFNQSDQTFLLLVDNNTPLALSALPESEDMLARRGFEEVLRASDADVQITVSFNLRGQENSGRRVGNTLGGALFGAAAGALLGALAGDPARGAAIGAVAGGASGAVQPARDFVVEAKICMTGTGGRQCQEYFEFNITRAGPENGPVLIDQNIASILARTMAK